MDKIFVFSGTSEGREISEFLSENKIKHRVFVATEYGEIVMDASSYASINKGRLDFKMMQSLFEEDKPEIIVDATHPFAVEVTQNIKMAAESVGGIKYIRVQRDLPLTEQLLREDYPNIEIVTSTEAALDYLNGVAGNILLTTGVKTLSAYSACKFKERLVARILPSKESLGLAYDAGLLPRQIIAMEGPFLASVNEALIEQYKIEVLVTKNSGIKGGFLEKLEACKNKGIKALVIDPGKLSEGLSLEDAKREILFSTDNLTSNDLPFDKTSEAVGEIDASALIDKKIKIVGIGVANDKSLTIAAKEAIVKADVLIGAHRMIGFGASLNKRAQLVEEYEPAKVLAAVNGISKENFVVLVSGDTGFYSGAGAIYERLKASGHKVELLPAVSSISYFCALIGQPYSNASIVSNHGTKNDVVEELKSKNKVFSIVSGFEDINEIISSVTSVYGKARFYVGYNLGMEDERVDSFDSQTFREYLDPGLYVIGVMLDE